MSSEPWEFQRNFQSAKIPTLLGAGTIRHQLNSNAG